MSLSIRIIAIIMAGFSFLRAYTQSVETVVQTGHYGPVTAVCYSYDGQAFADAINSKAAKLFNKIHVYTLLDKEATKSKILATLDEMSKQMKKEDVFVWFYAGHGSIVDNGFYFITSEVTGLYQQDKLRNALYVKELQDKFKLLPALKQVVFIDACQSGSSVEALAMRGGAEEKALAQLSRSQA